MKSFENQFRDTRKVAFMLDKSMEPLSPQLGKNFGKKDFVFYSGKCRIMSKRGTLWDLLTYILLQNIKKLEGARLRDLQISKKKSHNAEKNRKGTLCSNFRFQRFQDFQRFFR